MLHVVDASAISSAHEEPAEVVAPTVQETGSIAIAPLQRKYAKIGT